MILVLIVLVLLLLLLVLVLLFTTGGGKKPRPSQSTSCCCSPLGPCPSSPTGAQGPTGEPGPTGGSSALGGGGNIAIFFANGDIRPILTDDTIAVIGSCGNIVTQTPGVQLENIIAMVQQIPFAGKLSQLRGFVHSGSNIPIQLQINVYTITGIDMTATTLGATTAVIPVASGTTYSDMVNSVSFNAGDVIVLGATCLVPIGANIVSFAISGSCVFTPN